MEGLVLLIHIVVCVLLIVIVLLQSGKSADLAGAFGGGGSQSTFGPRGTATLLSKMTTTLAILFMITSLSLWILAANRAGSTSVLSDDDIKQEQTTGDQTEATAPDTGETEGEGAKDPAAPAADPAKKETEETGKQEGQKEKDGTQTDAEKTDAKESEGSEESK